MPNSNLHDPASDAATTFDGLASRTHELEIGAAGFSRAMTSAFASAVSGGKQLDDVLKTLALRLSELSLRLALKPLTRGLASGIESLFSNLSGAGAASSATAAAGDGAIKPFAAGGVIGAPAYFPMLGGGVGLAGEAGPEAIMPLTRGADGRLGVAAAGGGATVVVQITTPDADSFRRSETWLAGQIARAVARGQRSL